jgi:hypothetical protein
MVKNEGEGLLRNRGSSAPSHRRNVTLLVSALGMVDWGNGNDWTHGRLGSSNSEPDTPMTFRIFDFSLLHDVSLGLHHHAN